MNIAKQLFDQAFAPEQHRDPRSEAYRDGVLAALQWMDALRPIPFSEWLPYALGTAEADAWLSGADEGMAIWRRHLDEHMEVRP